MAHWDEKNADGAGSLFSELTEWKKRLTESSKLISGSICGPNGIVSLLTAMESFIGYKVFCCNDMFDALKKCVNACCDYYDFYETKLVTNMLETQYDQVKKTMNIHRSQWKLLQQTKTELHKLSLKLTDIHDAIKRSLQEYEATGSIPSRFVCVQSN